MRFRKPFLFIFLFCILPALSGCGGDCSGDTAPPYIHYPAPAQEHFLYGGVTDADTGEPIAGAAVTLTGPETRAFYSAETDGAGSYLFPSLSPGRYVLSCTAPGYRLPDNFNGEITVSGGTEKNIQMEPQNRILHSLRGRVTLAGREPEIPIAGAQVTLVRSGFQAVFAETDGNGDYSFPGLDEGNYEIGCSRTGFRLPDGFDAHVAVSGATSRNMAMEPISVGGTVTDAATGGVIAGARVSVTANGEIIGTAAADASGIYLIPLPADGIYRVAAEAAGYTGFEDDSVSVRGETEYSIEMTAEDPDETYSITVHIREADVPIIPVFDLCTVRCTPENGIPLSDLDVSADGAFNNLPPGNYRVQLVAWLVNRIVVGPEFYDVVIGDQNEEVTFLLRIRPN